MDFPSHVNLPKETREELVELLNLNLANSIDLYLQLKHAHWNVKGVHFVSRHELFDKLADKLRAQYDTLAERATQLGGYAEGTARLVSRNTQLPEYQLNIVDGDEQLAMLTERYGRYCASLREGISRSGELEDAATEDLFTELVREAEMDLWFLESHLIKASSKGADRGTTFEAAGATHPSH
jgi:starvation-inducible DNA-binding protein